MELCETYKAFEEDRLERWKRCGFAGDGTFVGSFPEDEDASNEDINMWRQELEAQDREARAHFQEIVTLAATTLQKAWRRHLERRKPTQTIFFIM